MAMPATNQGPESQISQAPASSAISIQPSDEDFLEVPTRAIYVGTGGSITAVLAGQQGANPSISAFVFNEVPQGTILPIRAVAILATGTDAENLVGLY
jgi:hypothetical protein